MAAIGASRFAGKVGHGIFSNLVEGDCAEVLVENRAMLTVLRRSGFRVGSLLSTRQPETMANMVRFVARGQV